MIARQCRVHLALLLVAASFLMGLAVQARAATVIINSNTSDPAPRAAFQALVDKFRGENPGTDVNVNYYDPESYKTALRGWLTSTPPDVILWNAGERMRQLVALGLLADVSDIWTAPS